MKEIMFKPLFIIISLFVGYAYCKPISKCGKGYFQTGTLSCEACSKCCRGSSAVPECLAQGFAKQHACPYDASCAGSQKKHPNAQSYKGALVAVVIIIIAGTMVGLILRMLHKRGMIHIPSLESIRSRVASVTSMWSLSGGSYSVQFRDQRVSILSLATNGSVTHDTESDAEQDTITDVIASDEELSSLMGPTPGLISSVQNNTPNIHVGYYHDHRRPPNVKAPMETDPGEDADVESSGTSIDQLIPDQQRTEMCGFAAGFEARKMCDELQRAQPFTHRTKNDNGRERRSDRLTEKKKYCKKIEKLVVDLPSNGEKLLVNLTNAILDPDTICGLRNTEIGQNENSGDGMLQGNNPPGGQASGIDGNQSYRHRDEPLRQPEESVTSSSDNESENHVAGRPAPNCDIIQIDPVYDAQCIEDLNKC